MLRIVSNRAEKQVFLARRAMRCEPLRLLAAPDTIQYLSQLPRGYVVASVEYRFSQKPIFPAQIQDCQAAIRWLRGNAMTHAMWITN